MLDSIRRRGKDFASDWAAPILLGLITAAVVWTVWYFTKAPCTTTAAVRGVCNPGVIARFIDVEILLQSGGAALAVGAIKGGYDKYMMRRMLNEEREARQQAEQQLAAERKRVDETIQQVNEARDAALQMIAEVVAELREERRLTSEERRQTAEERRQSKSVAKSAVRPLKSEERRQTAATQQALLDTIVRLTEQRNGRRDDPPEN